MLKVLKWIGIVLGALIGLILIALVVLALIGSSRVNAAAERPAEAFSAEGGDAENGRIVARAWGCTDCHGDDLDGSVFIDELPFGYLPAPNLTSGEGGAALSDTQLEHAIRHGIGGDGRKLIIMPSRAFTQMADSELADLIAFMRSAPAVDEDFGQRKLHPLGLILFGAGVIPMDAVITYGVIDHSAAHVEALPTDDLALGEYRAVVCKDCHGEKLNGGPLFFDPTVSVPNLTPGGDLAEWTEEDFIRAIREGKTPEGDDLDPTEMPWPNFALLSDADLHALWVYLQSLEALPTGGPDAP